MIKKFILYRIIYHNPKLLLLLQAGKIQKRLEKARNAKMALVIKAEREMRIWGRKNGR